MSQERTPALANLSTLSAAERVENLAALGRQLLERQAQDGSDAHGGLVDGARDEVVKTLVELLQDGEGAALDRLALGAALGFLGDPRLRKPSDAGYWATVEVDDGPLELGRFMVTNDEFRQFVDAGGYSEENLWDEDGRAWLESTEERWPALSATAESRPFVVPNQPVVGVTWFEAMAYARWVGARLPTFEERLRAVRGSEKRPYPWGSPFGEGNANTQEEVLGQPCAVGLYLRDCSPEGVYDLAGNVAEWCGDGVGGECWVHPGAWDQPSMAAWAKARVLEKPGTWSAALGFRLARDPR